MTARLDDLLMDGAMQFSLRSRHASRCQRADQYGRKFNRQKASANIDHASTSSAAYKLEFHDADTDTDTDVLARILADTSDARDFLKLFLRQAQRHADILATILARMSARKSVLVSVSWNASLSTDSTGGQTWRMDSDEEAHRRRRRDQSRRDNPSLPTFISHTHSPASSRRHPRTYPTDSTHTHTHTQYGAETIAAVPNVRSAFPEKIRAYFNA